MRARTDRWLEPIERPCPRCGARVVGELSCPGYGDPPVVCWPPGDCGNATEWRCVACGWWHQDNIAAARRVSGEFDGMGEAPAWLFSVRRG